jgi:hypothetical protein
MKMDPASIAAVVTAFTKMPVRVAAMERAVTELTAKVEALRAASPQLLLRLPEAAAIFKVSVATLAPCKSALLAHGLQHLREREQPPARCN